MARPEVLKETPISIVELKEEIEKIKKRDGELNFRANKTEEYLNQFVSFPLKKAEELKEKLEKLSIPRLKDEHMIKIIDLMPTNTEVLKVLLQAYTVTVTQENLKKIVGVVQEYASEK